MLDRLFALMIVGYAWMMLHALITAFQRIGRFWLAYHGQSARASRASAVHYREQAARWAGRAEAGTEDAMRSYCRAQSRGALLLAGRHDKAARHSEREVWAYRFFD